MSREDADVEQRLAVFESDVRGKLEHIDRNIADGARRTNDALDRLTDVVDKLSQHMVRTEEREHRQQAFNARMETEINSMGQRIRLLEDAHNRDSNMMSQLRKHWVFIVIAALGVMTLLPQFFDRLGG